MYEAKPNSGPLKSEDAAIDSEVKKHFSFIAEKYASEASKISEGSKN
jgi:major membrane immunogen (membrane-anchored lipoprotein)